MWYTVHLVSHQIFNRRRAERWRTRTAFSTTVFWKISWCLITTILEYIFSKVFQISWTYKRLQSVHRKRTGTSQGKKQWCQNSLKCNLRSWRFCCGARAIAEEMRANSHGNSSLVTFGDLTASCSWHAVQKNSQLLIRMRDRTHLSWRRVFPQFTQHRKSDYHCEVCIPFQRWAKTNGVRHAAFKSKQVTIHDTINDTAILIFSGVVQAHEHFNSKTHQEAIDFFKRDLTEKVCKEEHRGKTARKEATSTNYFGPKKTLNWVRPLVPLKARRNQVMSDAFTTGIQRS